MKLKIQNQGGWGSIHILVIIAILAFVTFLMLPTFADAITADWREKCVKNLQEMQRIAQEGPSDDLMAPSNRITNGLYVKHWYCPHGGTYSFKPGDTKPKCTIIGHSI